MPPMPNQPQQMPTMANQFNQPPGIDIGQAGPGNEQQGSIFSSPASKAAGAKLDSVAKEMNNASRQMRVLEERLASLRRKTQVTDQNMLSINKKVGVEIKVLKEDVNELRREIYDALEKIKIITGELKTLAPDDEVKVYTKYIELWEPIRFVPQENLGKVVQDAVEEYLSYRKNASKSGVINKALKPNRKV